MKSKTTAALLALFLGGIGMHKFYLGKWGWGLIYILFCWTFIPVIVAFIEAIILFTMDELEFHKKFSEQGLALMFPDGLVTPETHVRCPDCRELVRNDARKCKHCGCSLVPVDTPPSEPSSTINQ